MANIGKSEKGNMGGMTIFADRINRSGRKFRVIVKGHLLTYDDLLRLAKMEQRLSRYREKFNNNNDDDDE